MTKSIPSSRDQMKDQDNAGWVMDLEPDICQAWLERIRWIRLSDRLAEKQSFEHLGHFNEFSRFHAGWKLLLATGQVKADYDHQGILSSIQQHWFTPKRTIADTFSLQAWDRYLTAIARYHIPYLTLETLAQHQAMLEALGGSLSQVLPFLEPQHLKAIYYLGTLDQFYNNLRDLQEDAHQGICYFPEQVLRSFKVSRHEILSGNCLQQPGYYALMEFWLGDYLQHFRRQAREACRLRNLHPSWQRLVHWSFERYQRIERVLRSCDLDYTLFAEVYWAEVKRFWIGG